MYCKQVNHLIDYCFVQVHNYYHLHFLRYNCLDNNRMWRQHKTLELVQVLVLVWAMVSVWASVLVSVWV